MSEGRSGSLYDPKQYQVALSRWDDEGGAVSHDPPASSMSSESQMPAPQLTNTELVQLRIRVIALENLVIALLAEASDRQLGVVREMVACISPQPNFTQHPLTIRAAAQMTNLVDRAHRFREVEQS